jgi:hypothetical protein
MKIQNRTLSLFASSIVAAGMVALLVTPGITRAATSSAPARAVNAKSVSLRLADVLHVLGSGITLGDARSTTPHAIGVCTSTPPATDFLVNFSGPLHTKGILNVISDVVTYKSAGGPGCNQKYDISTYKILGGTLGKLTTVHGVGEQAFVLDTTGPKSQGPQLYSLALKFTRGLYRALIIVQSNQRIKVADMIKLGQIVDGRMKHTR